MGKSYRIGRLGEEIRRILSSMLLTEIKDPRLAGKIISVTGVDVTSDGSYATCYVTVLPMGGSDRNGAGASLSESEENEEVLAGLKSAAGLIRKEVSRQVKVRHTPELIFKIDSSMAYGRHIDDVISSLDIPPEIGTSSSLEEIAEALKKANKIMLYPHINMDGDALGSCAALALALRSMGKTAKVVLSEEVPDNLKFLGRVPEGAGDLVSEELGDALATSSADGDGLTTSSADGDGLTTANLDEAMNADVAVMVDCGEFKRISGREEAFKSAKLTICVDHHGTTDPICNMNYIDPDAAATGQIVFDLLDELEMDDSFDAAEGAGAPNDSAATLKLIGEAIFTAITTDTGDFQYSNTQKESHEIVAELYDWGIDHNWVSRQIYNNVRMERLKLTARVISEMELLADGKAALACVTQDMLRETGAKMEETEWIINDLRSIGGVELAVLLKEEEPNVVKCSLRSEEYVDVAELAKRFDGGGHIRAAGYTDYVSMPEAVERIKAAINEVL